MLCDKIEKTSLPDFIAVSGDQWVAEEKFDGDRIRLQVKDGKMSLITRSGKIVTDRYPELHSFPVSRDLFLDGEMCCLDENGLSQFNEGIAFRTHCQSSEKIRAAAITHPVTYVIFDIIGIDKDDIKDKPWSVRREILDGLGLDHPACVLSAVQYDVMKLWSYVTGRGGEGIILKKVNSPYSEGRRSSNWKKVKDIQEADVRVTKFSVNPKGIRVETDDGIACQVSGYNAPPVQAVLEARGEALITIRHLGWTGKKYRQPTFAKIVIQ